MRSISRRLAKLEQQQQPLAESLTVHRVHEIVESSGEVSEIREFTTVWNPREGLKTAVGGGVA